MLHSLATKVGKLARLVTMATLALFGCTPEMVPLVKHADAGATRDTRSADVHSPPGSCRTSDDCPTGKVCSRAAPGCVDPQCGVVTVDGWVAPGVPCYATRDCVLGYVCAPAFLEQRIPLGTSVSGRTIDLCAPACDPCAPTCPPEMFCIQLPEGGGFCNPGPLAGQGEPCGGNYCMAGMSCLWSTCLRRCTPEGDVDLPTSSSIGAPSPDCAPGELCVAAFAADPGGVHEKIHFCRQGIAATGEPCSLTAHCPHPNHCIEGVCTPENCGDGCPAPSRCFDGLVCARDGVIGYNRPCWDNANCKPGLSCLLLPRLADKRCLPTPAG